MRVVLDTNVIISGLLWKKYTKAIFDLIDRGKIELVVTPQIIFEIKRVLNYPRIKKQVIKIGLSAAEILAYLYRVAHIYPDLDISVDLSDKSDKMFLGAAIISKSKYIVSGDKHLLNLKSFDGIKILKPRKFLELFQYRYNK